MQRYIARRLLSLFVVLFIVSLGVFLILRVLPGDIVDAFAGEEEGSLSEEQAQVLREVNTRGESEVEEESGPSTQYFHTQGFLFSLVGALPITT